MPSSVVQNRQPGLETRGQRLFDAPEPVGGDGSERAGTAVVGEDRSVELVSYPGTRQRKGRY